MNPLEFVSTKELVEELCKRRTFVGVLIWSPHEHRREGQCHDGFKMFTSVDTDGTMELLDRAKESVEKT